MIGNKGLRHRGKAAGGKIKDTSAGPGSGAKSASKITPSSGSRIIAAAREGNQGGGNIGGGSGPTMGRRRGGGVGADKVPFSSAHRSGGACK